MLVEAQASPTEVLWLGRTVGVDEWGGACVRRFDGDSHKTIGGVRYDPGDHRVNVQWYSQLPGHQGASVFQREKNTTGGAWTDVFNSSELRLTNPMLDLVGGPPLPRRAASALRGDAAAAEEKAEGQRVWALDRDHEAAALAECVH